MSQVLYLLRHAKAVPWQPGVDDFSRPLSDVGRNHVSRLAAWIKAGNANPDCVLCSPSTRTLQTLQPLIPGFRAATPIHKDERIYGASTGTLDGLLQDAFKRYESVLLVGHNPGMESLCRALLAPDDANRVHKMATGTLAGLGFPDSYAADAGAAALTHWVTRKNLLAD